MTINNIKRKTVFNRQQKMTKENEIKVGDKYINDVDVFYNDYPYSVTVISVIKGKKQYVIEFEFDYCGTIKTKLLYINIFKLYYREAKE
jgi:hypothetical protein